MIGGKIHLRGTSKKKRKKREKNDIRILYDNKIKFKSTFLLIVTQAARNICSNYI